MLPNLSLLPASAKPKNGFEEGHPPKKGEGVDRETPLHERALAKAQGPLEQAFLVGRANQMVPQSQPTQLYGATQREAFQLSNNLLESHVRVRMYAGYPNQKSPPDPDTDWEDTDWNLELHYPRAQKSNQRKGIVVSVLLSCHFSPHRGQFTDEKQKAIVTAGLNRLYEKAALVTKPFREDLVWMQLADVIQRDMDVARLAAKPSVNPVRDKSRLPEVDVLAAVDQAGQPGYKPPVAAVLTDGAEIHSQSQSFLSFAEGRYSVIHNTGDGSLAYAFPEEFQVYVSAMFKNLAEDPDTRFGLVCLKGDTFQFSFEQNAYDIVEDIKRGELDRLAELVKKM